MRGNAVFSTVAGLLRNLPQMELYCGIGRLVSGRRSKGAAVAAAEYLCSAYPDASGFSPRNLRRMREFYRTYESAPEVLGEAMTIGWTQNVVIMEAELTLQERTWYIQKAQQLGWSKLTLLEKIKSGVHNEIVLDFRDEVCYTDDHDMEMEYKSNDEDTFYLPRQYLSEPNGRVRDEESGKESRIGEPIPY